MRNSFLILFLYLSLSASGATYYVATSGSDSNPGTIAQPFGTWQKAFNIAVAGDLVYIRGGTYYPKGTVSHSYACGVAVDGKNGSSKNPIRIWAYPGESPVLDCRNITNYSNHIGILLFNADYWHLKGLQITKVNEHSSGDYPYNAGLLIYSGNNNKIETLKSYSNGGSGIQVLYASEDNVILNCDSYSNYDPYSKGAYIPGDQADGIEIAFITERNGDERVNSMIGCRSWDNSDDGFDHYKGEGILIFESCWTWHNGYIPGTDTRAGNGNGFKFGTTAGKRETVPQRYVSNCITYNNRQRGYSQENANVIMKFYNNIAYRNKLQGFNFQGYSLPDVLRNNLSYKNGSTDIFNSSQIKDHNSWDSGVNVSDADFVSIDWTELASPRKEDGSLPEIGFLHLVSGSDLIDAGTDVELAYSGKAPDIGAFEFQSGSPPSTPLYNSSVVKNTTPAIIEIVYNLNLANIVPSSSAFRVEVNSTARTINSVSISGKNVMLTLSSPVFKGDIVTISYTKPITKPLQTASGGQAASLSAKPVVNNVTTVDPSIPVYVSSAIRNATPNTLEISYNISLAMVVSASSAFSVKVNSVARTINTVTITGPKVFLTLSSPVVYGDVVTISYTKPSLNPLQSSAGKEAASISDKPVTNNCIDPNKPNEPPVVVLNYETESFSGFICELDASGTHDPENDTLTYQWIVPPDVSVSSTTTSKIEFLSPIVLVQESIEFQLDVWDGTSTISKSIQINIMPYKPELDMAIITNIKASEYQALDYPKNASDGYFATKWSVSGDNQWLLLKLDKTYKISHLAIAFLKDQKYTSYFDILASKDNVTWEPILINAKSCDFSGDAQVFDFPEQKKDFEYSYLKLIGHGNSLNSLNNISELKVFWLNQENPIPEDPEKSHFIIYPNPARDNINISVKDPVIEPDLIRLIDLSGRIVFEDYFKSGINIVQIPAYLKAGFYIVELKAGNLILHSQNLIVRK